MTALSMLSSILLFCLTVALCSLALSGDRVAPLPGHALQANDANSSGNSFPAFSAIDWADVSPHTLTLADLEPVLDSGKADLAITSLRVQPQHHWQANSSGKQPVNVAGHDTEEMRLDYALLLSHAQQGQLGDWTDVTDEHSAVADNREPHRLELADTEDNLLDGLALSLAFAVGDNRATELSRHELAALVEPSGHSKTVQCQVTTFSCN